MNALIIPGKLYRLHQNILILMQVIQKGSQAILIAEGLFLRLLRPFIRHHNGNAGQKERFFPGPFTDHIILEISGRKDGGIRLEADNGTMTVCPAELFQFSYFLSAI